MYNTCMIDLEDIIDNIENYGSFTFSLSGGPGGQNVNKLNTSVLLRIPVTDLHVLSEAEKEHLRIRLAGRINQDDELFIQSRQERSQLRNRRNAVLRLAELIRANIKEEKPRRPTKPSKKSRENRLNDKKRRSEIKKIRRQPPEF